MRFVLIVFSLFWAFQSFGQLLGQYNFTGNVGSEVSANPDGQPSNGAFSAIRRGSGITPPTGTANSAFGATGFTTASNPDTADYFQFSLQANIGFKLKLDSIKLAERRSNTGIRTWAIRTSFDNFAGNVSTFNVPDTNIFRFNQNAVFGSQFSNLPSSSPLIIRIYGYSAEAETGTWRLDSIRVYGQIETIGSQNPIISFQNPGATITEGDSALFRVETNAMTTQVFSIVQKSGNAQTSDWSSIAPLTNLMFPFGNNFLSGQFNALSDGISEGTETAVFVLRTSSPTLTIGSDSTFTLTINDNGSGQTGPPFTRTIAQVRGANTNGQADSLGRNVRLFGTVYGVNQRLTATGGGYQMFIRDATGGIGIFKTRNLTTIPSLNEGDSVWVEGTIGVFRGLSQIVIDTMFVLATGRPLKNPSIKTILGETDESDLVRLNNVTLVSPAAWTGTGTGFTVQITDGTNISDVRIDNDCPLYNQPAPTGTFSILGMVGQFASTTTAPFVGGYQLVPRKVGDLIASTPNQKPTVRFSIASASVTEFNGDVTMNVVADFQPAVNAVIMAYLKGGTATNGVDYGPFQSVGSTMGPGQQTTLNLPLGILDDVIAEPTETLILVLRKSGVAGDTSFIIGADSIFTLTINDNDSPAQSGPPFTRSIAQIRGSNNGNQADSVGRNVRLFGTVYGLNQRLTATTGGYQMFIRDATGGIGIFKNDTVSNIVSLNEGDSIKVMGKVEVFRGLSQINPDSMVVLATGRPIKSPTVANKLNENLEADLVRLNGVQLVNPDAWTTGAGSAGFTVRVFKGLDTNDVRIDNDCPFFNQPAPSGTFDIIGMGSQFVPGTPTPVAPFPASGYQLIPRRISDLITSPPSNPTCSFSIPAQNVNENGDSIRVVVNINPSPTQEVKVRVERKSGTAVIGTDYTPATSNTLFFTPGSSSQTFKLLLLDDAVADGNKNLVLALRTGLGTIVPNAEIGADSIQTVTIIDNETSTPGGVPFTRTIAQIKGSSAGNQADSVGRNVRLIGVVYGLNQRLTAATGGYQMFLRDATGGIGIFKTAPVSGIMILNEGDSVRVMGKIEVFRGLSQINPDSMVVLATGRPLKSPVIITSINESMEGDLLRMNNVSLVSPAAWTGTGTGFTVQVTDGTNTIDVRIDNDCPLYSQPAPTTPFHIIGMGGQFSSSTTAPFADGYQLIPRRATDLIPVVSLDPLCHCDDEVKVYPNPGRSRIQIESKSDRNLTYQFFNGFGQMIYLQNKSAELEYIETSFWKSGVYSIRVKETGKVIRWIKQ
jgi:DNA/RNA endonuclease YhcR with UshA esterase domain